MKNIKRENGMHFICFRFFFSTVHQTRVSWRLSIRKLAPWYNSLFEKFGNSMLYCFAFVPEAPIKRFQCKSVNLRTVQRIQEDVDGFNDDFQGMAVWKPHSDYSDKQRTPKLVGEIQAMTDNIPSESLTDMRMSEFLWQVVHEDICNIAIYEYWNVHRMFITYIHRT